MKLLILLLKWPLLIQFSENTKAQIMFDSVEYTFIYICIISAIIFMISIPVLLASSIINSFLNLQTFNNKINVEFCCNDKKYNKNYSTSICKKYLKSYSEFSKSIFGLAIWNLFSLAYIIVGFENFSIGLKEYFYFPFNVLKSLNHDDLLGSSFSSFSSSWSYMLIIGIATFIFYFLGGFIGRYFALKNLKNKNLNFSLSFELT